MVLFGDESSFGLGAALRAIPGFSATFLFEATEIAESRLVLDAIGLGEATVIERAPDDAHLAAIAAEMSSLAAGGANFVLTGKARSIQQVSRVLKTVGVGSSRVKAKAYWAPGKVGLD